MSAGAVGTADRMIDDASLRTIYKATRSVREIVTSEP